MNKRHFLRTIAVLPAVFATRASLSQQVGVTTSAPPVLSSNSLPTDHIFAPTSFWYQPIPKDAPLNPLSAVYAADINRQIVNYYNGVGVNVSSYASPVYVVGPEVPPIAVTPSYAPSAYALKPLLAAVPIPPHAIPALGTDAEMTIWRPSTDEMWEMWQAKKDVNGKWTAAWGGKMENVSKTDGIWAKKHPFIGATATGLPFLGGQVTADELRRGEIRHVMGLAIPSSALKTALLSWPAYRGDGRNKDNQAEAIPQGIRIRLDPTIDLSTLKLHPIARTIAKAGQIYGWVVWDNAGAVGMRFQNPYDHTRVGKPNPYTALMAGTQSYDLLRRIPWGKLQFMPQHYGKPI